METVGHRHRGLRLRWHLVILVCVALLPVLIFTTVMVDLFQRQRRTTVERGLREVVRAATFALDREATAWIGALATLAASEHLDTGDVAAFHGAAQRILPTQPTWKTVMLSSAARQPLVDLRRPFGASLRAAADAASFGEVLRTRQPVVAAVAADSEAAGPTAWVHVPVVRDDVLRYILTATVDARALADVLALQPLAQESAGMILDRAGTIVASTQPAVAGVGQQAPPAIVARVGAAREGVIVPTADEGESLTVFSRSALSGWTVVFELPASTLQPRRLMPAVIVGGVTLLLLGVGLALVVGGRIAGPIAALSASARALCLGEPAARRRASVAEVNDLALAMTTAGAERKRAEQALRNSEARLRVALEATATATWEWNVRTDAITWSEGAAALFGIPSNTLGETLRAMLAIVHPDDRDGVEASLRRHGDDGSACDIEFRISRPADGTRWIALRGNVVGWPRDVAARMAGVAIDVTERKVLSTESEARRRTAEALSEVGKVMAQSLDLQEVGQRIADIARTLLRARVCTLYRMLPGTEDLEVLAVSGDVGPDFAPRVVVPAGTGVVGLAACERRIVVTADVTNDDRVVLPSQWRTWADHASYRAVLAVPLVVNRGVAGIFAIGDRAGRRFDDADIRLAQAFADHAAITLENARLYDEAERRRRESESARAEAEAMNRAKDEFLAMLSHELRNPLASVRSATEVIARRDVVDPPVRHAREVIERQVAHLARLLDDLLDVSRITGGLVELRRAAVDVRDLAREAVAAARPLFESRQLALSIVPGNEPLTVDADPTRLAQILDNLLTNAAKYTLPGGQACVTTSREDEQAVVRVRDSGIGIPAHQLDQIFDLFTQVSPSVARSEGGLGIGLTLVRRLVEMHGGTVDAASEGPGQGSEFVVRLPLAAQPAVTEAGAGPPKSPDSAGRRILVIEDNADAREMLIAALRMDGHWVDGAADGVTGVDLAVSESPDIVLVDIGLPGIDGYEVARRIRARLGDGVKLIALTGYGQAQDRRQSMEAGFDVHLVKPLSPDALDPYLLEADVRRAETPGPTPREHPAPRSGTLPDHAAVPVE